MINRPSKVNAGVLGLPKTEGTERTYQFYYGCTARTLNVN